MRTPDAPLTQRDLLVEIGAADYKLEDATRVLDVIDVGVAGVERAPEAGCKVSSVVEPVDRFGAALGLGALMVLGVGLRLRAGKSR